MTNTAPSRSPDDVAAIGRALDNLRISMGIGEKWTVAFVTAIRDDCAAFETPIFLTAIDNVRRRNGGVFSVAGAILDECKAARRNAEKESLTVGQRMKAIGERLATPEEIADIKRQAAAKNPSGFTARRFGSDVPPPRDPAEAKRKAQEWLARQKAERVDASMEEALKDKEALRERRRKGAASG